MTNGGAEPLSEEAERLLAGVREHIGDSDTLPDAVEVPDGGGDNDASILADLVGSEIVDADDVHHVLVIVGGLLDRLRNRELYRAAMTDGGMLAAKPWALVINHVWVTYAPSVLTDVCDSVPGLAKALVMSTAVLAAPVMADMELTRKEKEAAVSAVRPGASFAQAVAKPARAARAGFIYDEGEAA